MVRVSPAHAGIDPRWLFASYVDKRLPRTRGDRPQAWSVVEPGRESPPHTRGSTRRRAALADTISVSPAHAGIDPLSRLSTICWPCLPRTRGDRPAVHREAVLKQVSPPHTRGSTPPAVRGFYRGPVSPAHAGIDPGMHQTRTGTRRLPRTRGDRPMVVRAFVGPSRSPPHTRGSTRVSKPAIAGSGVSPAHAGIDPSIIASNLRNSCLPRTRGDRPVSSLAVPACDQSPPHTRGSTSGPTSGVSVWTVSPAHAGIDPLWTHVFS